MNLKTFIKSYDLLDIEIIDIKYINNSIYMHIKLDIDIGYIANGYRPEFEYDVTHLFIFDKQDPIKDINEKVIVTSYDYKNDMLSLNLSNKETIIIKDSEIIIKNNK